jgi:hypothetical protein
MEYHVLAVGAGGDMRPLFTVPGSASQTLVTGLDPSIGFTLVLKAVDVLGRESAPSNPAQTAVAPTATPITPPFSGSQPYGGAGLPPPGGASAPVGPTAQNGPAPYAAPPPTGPYGPSAPGVPPAYQPGVSAPPAYQPGVSAPPVLVPTPTLSIYQAPLPAPAPYNPVYPPR